MNPSSDASLEKRIIESLNQMAKQYRSLNLLADGMLDKQSQQQSIDDDMKALQSARESLVELEQSSRHDQEEYRRTRAHASEQVKQLTGQTAASIQSLVVKIAELEKNTQESYDRLLPEINQMVRGHQMQRAYGQSR